MPRLLLVSYYFPPANTIGALRAGKLAKYLPDHGWEPWILTLRDGLFASAGALPVEVPAQRVLRADLGRLATRLAERRRGRTGGGGAGRPGRGVWVRFSALFSDVRFPDRALPWCLPAIARGSELLRRERFDAIVSSHGPPSSHLVAAVLARRFRLPWVADFRDLWSGNHVHIRAGLPLRLETMLERRVLGRAVALTTVSAPLARRLAALHSKPVSVLPNGFDAADYAGEPPPERADSFVIVYTGTVYPGKQDPGPVLAAVAALGAQGVRIELHFYGSDAPPLAAQAQACGAGAYLHLHPAIPHREAVARQQAADALLLLAWTDPGSDGVYTGKVFEYLGARRPILATGPGGGVIERLLADTGAGTLVRDRAAAVARLRELLRQKRECGTTRLPERAETLQLYTRRYQAGVLARLLEGVVGRTRVSACP